MSKATSLKLKGSADFQPHPPILRSWNVESLTSLEIIFQLKDFQTRYGGILRSIPLAPFPVYMFTGVNLFPNVFSKPLELQNGERGGIFRCLTKNMNDFLGYRPMFPVCACLNLFVQAIRQILDVQGSHQFLHNTASMEEPTVRVNVRHWLLTDNDYRATANVRASD